MPLRNCDITSSGSCAQDRLETVEDVTVRSTPPFNHLIVFYARRSVSNSIASLTNPLARAARIFLNIAHLSNLLTYFSRTSKFMFHEQAAVSMMLTLSIICLKPYAPHPTDTKLSITRFRPACSNSISSLLPSISTISP